MCSASAVLGVARADDLGTLGTQVHQIPPCPNSATTNFAKTIASSLFSLLQRAAHQWLDMVVPRPEGSLSLKLAAGTVSMQQAGGAHSQQIYAKDITNQVQHILPLISPMWLEEM